MQCTNVGQVVARGGNPNVGRCFQTGAATVMKATPIINSEEGTLDTMQHGGVDYVKVYDPLQGVTRWQAWPNGGGDGASTATTGLALLPKLNAIKQNVVGANTATTTTPVAAEAGAASVSSPSSQSVVGAVGTAAVIGENAEMETSGVAKESSMASSSQKAITSGSASHYSGSNVITVLFAVATTLATTSIYLWR